MVMSAGRTSSPIKTFRLLTALTVDPASISVVIVQTVQILPNINLVQPVEPVKPDELNQVNCPLLFHVRFLKSSNKLTKKTKCEISYPAVEREPSRYN